MIKFRVKVLLAMNEMTQKELAERTGIRPPTVSAICDVLNCQPGDLMEFIPDKKEEA